MVTISFIGVTALLLLTSIKGFSPYIGGRKEIPAAGKGDRKLANEKLEDIFLAFVRT